MTNVAACDTSHPGEGGHYSLWLEGKEAYREFQERRSGDPEYYVLVASLAA